MAETGRDGVVKRTALERLRVATLRKRAEFQRVRGGPRIARPAFLLTAARGGDPNTVRFGLTITKKIGQAVERNRIRRRLRAAIRTLDPEILEAGADYVLIARRAALSQPFCRLVGDLRSSIGRIFAKSQSTRHHPTCSENIDNKDSGQQNG